MNYRALEKLGRVRLSENFFFREFMHSDVGNFYSIPNIPVDPDLAIETGRKLCGEILEPLQAHYGRLFIRSGYRSPALNEFCFKKRLGCAENENNYAYHIWDVRDKEGYAGAMACVVIPSYVDEYERTGDHAPVANWIADHLDCSDLTFFQHLCAFNIGWHEKPKKRGGSFISK